MRRVIMRSLIFVPFMISACATGDDLAAPSNVRDLLERGAPDLAVATAESAGTVSAARKSDGEWVPSLQDLAIQAGTVAVSAEADGTLVLDDVSLDIGTIEIPETVLGYPVQLTDIHIGLVAPVKCLAEWSALGDEAHCNATVDLSLDWSLVNHGSTSPLGSPDLPPVPVEIVVTGTGSSVHAELRVLAPGNLWDWAGLIRFDDLSLVVAADSN
jgi:hypothetical protein